MFIHNKEELVIHVIGVIHRHVKNGIMKRNVNTLLQQQQNVVVDMEQICIQSTQVYVDIQ